MDARDIKTVVESIASKAAPETDASATARLLSAVGQIAFVLLPMATTDAISAVSFAACVYARDMGLSKESFLEGMGESWEATKDLP